MSRRLKTIEPLTIDRVTRWLLVEIAKRMKRSPKPLSQILLSIAFAASVFVPVVSAQVGFQTLDPFYQDESARRDFFSNVSVSGEVGFRTTSLLRPSSDATSGLGAMVASAQIDYALMRQVDVSGIVDLTGGVGQGTIGLSWLVVKPYWHNDGTDYAIRIAVDPASEGSLGFRQTDVAFLSTSANSPNLISTFAIGVRRVRAGYDTSPVQAITGENPPIGTSNSLLADIERTRIIGREFHASWGYSFVFDPSGSRIALALLGEAGDYTLLRPTAANQVELASESEDKIRSGMVWMRAGIELSRPTYKLAPYVSVPVVTWANVEGESVRHGPRADKAEFGLRVTLR